MTCQVSAVRQSGRPQRAAERRARARHGGRPWLGQQGFLALGQRPGGRCSPVLQLRQPGRRPDQRRDGPQAQGDPHRPGAAPGRLVDRHRDQRADDRAGRHRGQVHPDQQPGPFWPAALDQARQQHVHQRDRPAGQDGAGEQQRAGGSAAHRQAASQQDQGRAQDTFLAERPAQRRGDPGEQPEAQHRDGGQEGLAGRGQVHRGVQLGEQRRQAGDRGPQVESEDEDPGYQQAQSGAANRGTDW